MPGIVVDNSADVASAMGKSLCSLREGEDNGIDAVRSSSVEDLAVVDDSSFVSLFRLCFDGG